MVVQWWCNGISWDINKGITWRKGHLTSKHKEELKQIEIYGCFMITVCWRSARNSSWIDERDTSIVRWGYKNNLQRLGPGYSIPFKAFYGNYSSTHS
jgi:hypothetical protein